MPLNTNNMLTDSNGGSVRSNTYQGTATPAAATNALASGLARAGSAVQNAAATTGTRTATPIAQPTGTQNTAGTGALASGFSAASDALRNYAAAQQTAMRSDPLVASAGAGAGIPGGAGSGAGSGTGARSSGYRSSGGGSSAAAPARSYTAPTLPTATSQADYINAMLDANRAAEEANLRAAYEANLNDLNYRAERLPQTYDAAANQAAIQAAINRQNFNQSAAASGLGSGAAAQAVLSQNNALLGNITSIRQAQSNALADVEHERTQMEAQYRNAINQAIAQNDLQRAQALYQEAQRVDDSIVNTAINQANLDWQVWNALYNR